MKKLTILTLVTLGFSAGFVFAGNASPPPVATPALDSWGLLGLTLLVPVVAALAYKNKK